MNSPRYIRLVIVIQVLQFSREVNSLFCYNCINLGCSENDQDCQEIKKFLVSELSHLYYLGDYLPPCPGLNDTYTWAIMQMSESPCSEQKSGEATCTLGRIQIRTIDPHNKLPVRYHHATVLGCARRELLHRTRTSTVGNQCDSFIRRKGNANIMREVEIEHCRALESQCHGKDFCINWRNSGIKSWRNAIKQSSFEWNIVVAMGALVGVAFLVALLARGCNEPTSRPNNSPKCGLEYDSLETNKIFVNEGEDREISNILEDEVQGPKTVKMLVDKFEGRETAMILVVENDEQQPDNNFV